MYPTENQCEVGQETVIVFAEIYQLLGIIYFILFFVSVVPQNWEILCAVCCKCTFGPTHSIIQMELSEPRYAREGFCARVSGHEHRLTEIRQARAPLRIVEMGVGVSLGG